MPLNAHTPGPWSIGIPLDEKYAHTLASGRLIFSDASDGGACVAVTNPHFGRGEADAHLIAAAPELLASLKEALEASGCDGDLCAHRWHESARAAISKAEGREP